MTVSLLRLEAGCSLEFAPSDIERVKAALEQLYGVPLVGKSSPILTVYTFASANLIFQNEWEDPCLIANEPEGVAMLEQVAKALG
ncbi:hypothetical protein [Caulobacter sp.]|uniref:hypothetical protein n=1 Tax=Caulobacter sp. TaxID=78 RepID=UPI002B46D439|nr:hypothetical protein [Caulobacter sp.]HJV43899.1 hypothetical protein [Caulobacter sp.]